MQDLELRLSEPLKQTPKSLIQYMNGYIYIYIYICPKLFKLIYGTYEALKNKPILNRDIEELQSMI